MPVSASQTLSNQPATSMPSSPRTATANASPVSHATTLASRRPRDGSPNGNHHRRRGAAAPWRFNAGSAMVGSMNDVRTRAEGLVRQPVQLADLALAFDET